MEQSTAVITSWQGVSAGMGTALIMQSPAPHCLWQGAAFCTSWAQMQVTAQGAKHRESSQDRWRYENSLWASFSFYLLWCKSGETY